MEVWISKGAYCVFSTEEKALAYLKECRQASMEYHRANSMMNRKVSEIIKWKDGSRLYYKSGGCTVGVRKVTVDAEAK